ncbi:PorP/SprF family type IX secretion system membrane protein [Roseimarinus sediminis]|uniref:PorP/SprF family type IX secretion system membrane protein n=1 Tax=Roseimarinus sediminis TaxID=1610899 RepID=UPI003D1EDE7F
MVLLFLMLAALRGLAQQDPMFTQYMNNPVLINPAYAGSYGDMNFNGIFRKQWVGFDWQPTTTSLSVNSPFFNYNVGVGFTFLHDQIGPLTQTGVYMDYAYHIDYDNGARLSMGLKGGFNYFQKDLRELTTDEYDTWIALAPVSSKFLFNAGIGVYYRAPKYFAGFSIPKLIRNSLSDVENTYEIVGREERHYFLTGGALFDVNTIMKFKPTAMMRVVNGSPFSIDVSATLIFYERLWAGLMYRFGDAMGAHARFEIRDGLQLGYAFDLTNSRLRGYNAGTHEIFFSYTFGQGGQRILSPRYF